MDTRNAQIDLNLLVYFDALYTERHVSHAAEKVNLSQPAMSLALKRLRAMFGDELLIRTSTGMVLTNRAQELIGPVREMLRQSRVLLEPRKESGLTEESRVFALVATEYVSSVILPKLVKYLDTNTPHVRLMVHAANPDHLKRWFDDGTVELGIGYCEAPPSNLRMRRLFEERVVCIVRKGHPQVGSHLSLEQLSRLPQIQVSRMRSPRFAIAIERTISNFGLEPCVGLVVSDFLVVPDMVASSDMIAFVPEALAQRAAAAGTVQIIDVDLMLPPLIMSLLWHERTHADPNVKWLRDVVHTVCK
jgi:DNA-binding transcriptional LysR family regulator